MVPRLKVFSRLDLQGAKKDVSGLLDATKWLEVVLALEKVVIV
jgi:hypothetical protein